MPIKLSATFINSFEIDNFCYPPYLNLPGFSRLHSSEMLSQWYTLLVCALLVSHALSQTPGGGDGDDDGDDCVDTARDCACKLNLCNNKFYKKLMTSRCRKSCDRCDEGDDDGNGGNGGGNGGNGGNGR